MISWSYPSFCLCSGTAAASLSTSLCWLILSQALLRPCLVKAGTLMLSEYDINKLLTESRLNHNSRCESPVTSWKLPIGSWPWARIQFSYHQLTFMTTGLSWCTWKIQLKQVNVNEKREKRCQHMVKGSVLWPTSFCFSSQKTIFLFLRFLLKA